METTVLVNHNEVDIFKKAIVTIGTLSLIKEEKTSSGLVWLTIRFENPVSLIQLGRFVGLLASMLPDQNA